jgi:hypothetical protein
VSPNKRDGHKVGCHVHLQPQIAPRLSDRAFGSFLGEEGKTYQFSKPQNLQISKPQNPISQKPYFMLQVPINLHFFCGASGPRPTRGPAPPWPPWPPSAPPPPPQHTPRLSTTYLRTYLLPLEAHAPHGAWRPHGLLGPLQPPPLAHPSPRGCKTL